MGDEHTKINELSMLRRIGAIEERVMQRVLLKILHETETSQQTSETWKRLRKYQGLGTDTTRDDAGSRNTTSSSNASEVVPVRMSDLVVDPPSVRDAIVQDAKEDSEDPQSDITLSAIHPDTVRQQQSNINKVSSSHSHSSATISSSSTGAGSLSAAAAAALQTQRKLAAISF